MNYSSDPKKPPTKTEAPVSLNPCPIKSKVIEEIEKKLSELETEVTPRTESYSPIL